MRTNSGKLVLVFIFVTLLIGCPGLKPVAAQELAQSNHLISLQYVVIDTRIGEPALPPSLEIDSYGPDESGYYLVQFVGAILPEWKEQVTATGIRLLNYVPNNAFITRMTEAQRSQIDKLNFVQWIGIFQPAYRIMPGINLGERSPSVFTVATFSGDDFGAITRQIDQTGGRVLYASENAFGGTIRVVIPPDRISNIARINGVMWIEPYIEPELSNDVAREIMNVDATVWNVQGLYGAGQIVAVADTGLDVGQNDASLSDDFEGRIVAAYGLGRTGDWSDPNGHGTHVAGSAVGSGRYSGSNPDIHSYADSYAGVAPEARLVFQSTLSSDGGLHGLPADLNILFQQAFDDGARIHTNSWGSPERGAYTAYSAQVDQFVWAHPDMVILFAAGNAGVDNNANGVVDQDSIASPGTAKNAITVGATESLRFGVGYTGRWIDRWSALFPSHPISADLVSNNSSGMAAFSSRGPVDGDRIKPELVAPGTNILSARTHQHTVNMGGESGLAGWTADAPWSITLDASHSGVNGWGTGIYANNLNVSLTSPVIDIRTGANTIGFWTRYNLGSGDRGLVEYRRVMGGAETWIQCPNLAITSAQTNWIFMSCSLPTFSAEQGGLDDSEKQGFRFRFRLQSDNTNVGTGWQVDDILVIPQGWGFAQQGGEPDEDYLYMGGTSMATPLVAGGATLVRQYYMDRGHVPSAALVKATLVNGAVNIAPGQYGIGGTQEISNTRPNTVTGWGRVDLQNALFPAPPQTLLYQDIANAEGLNTTQIHIYRYEVRDRTVPFRATLVWADFPGTLPAGEPRIINDLDMTVRTPNGIVYFPNARTAPDDDNNTEDVFIDTAAVVTGTYVIAVVGRNVPSGPQGYALQVRGGNLVQSLDILQPTESSPAYAGSKDNPLKIVVHVSKPLAGLSKQDFQVQIGGVAVSLQDIIAFYEGSNEYVLEIQPPAQSVNALFPLTVTTGVFSDSESRAVLYSDSNNIDAELVIDRSGSMSDNNKMSAARLAAKQFVDFMRNGDMIGVVSFDSAVVTAFPLSPILPQSFVPPIFGDNMESGASKWVANVPWGLTSSSSHSPTHAWTDSPNGNYGNNINTSLQSASPITITGSITTPVLGFWHRYQLESCCDRAYVEISINNGGSWTALATYSGSNTTWTKVEIPLISYKGRRVLFRFRIATDHSVTYDGWYIDDIEIGQSKGDVRTRAKTAIDSLTPGGSTSIGGGLQRGHQQLTTLGNDTHPWAIILLTDGHENSSPLVADILPIIESSRVVVHTIGLGSDADQSLLLNIAARTNGTYNFAPSIDQLSGIYSTISGGVSNQQVLRTVQGIAQQGMTNQIDVVIDSTISDATFSLRWSNSSSSIDLALRRPDGVIITPTIATTDPNIEYSAGSTYAYYRIKTPTLTSGIWRMLVTGGSALSVLNKGQILAVSGEPYEARVTAFATLTMRFDLDGTNYVTRQPIRFVVSLADSQPIQGALVEVSVQQPSAIAQTASEYSWVEVNGDTIPDPQRATGSNNAFTQSVTTASISLYDDGLHGDGLPNDGIYANVFQGASAVGTYSFLATAAGANSAHNPFTREARISTYVSANPIANPVNVSLVSGQLSSIVGQPVVLTATVTSPVGFPTGLVTFRKAGSALGEVTLDNSGMAILTISDLAVGSHTISARYEGDVNYPFRTSPSINQHVSIGPPASVMMHPDTSFILANGSSKATLTTTVVNAYGHPVPNSRVSFVTSAGSVTSQATTNSSGIAVATLTAATQARVAIITATAGTASGNTTVNFIAGPPTALTVAPAPATILADGASTSAIQATVKDAFGNPVANQVVNFTANLGGITAQATTNADGVAVATLTSATQIGVATVTVTAGAASGSTTVTFVSGAATTVTLAPTPGTILADGASTSAINVEVRDAFGNPVANQVVNFSTSLGNITAQVITDGNGKATVTLTSAAQVGIATVTATAGAANGSTTVIFIGNAITGLVFVDMNLNGVRDDGESGIAGATISIVREGSATAVTLVSDATGAVAFAALPGGVYKMTVAPPHGFSATTATEFTLTLGADGINAPAVGVIALNYLPLLMRN